MTRRTLGVVVAVVSLAGLARAHEGHAHKYMGKVAAVSENKIEVETTDGKKVEAALVSTTKYLRDKTPAARTDVKVGERVVIVVVEDKGQKSVKQVLLGAAAGEAAKPKKP